MARAPGTRRLVTGDGTLVAGEVAEAATMVSRGLGLMFRRELAPGHGLAITPCNSIHMFFMRFPLDVAFVDREGTVLRVYQGIRPWRVSRMVRRARTAYELPAGTLQDAGVVAGSTLRLE